MATSKLTQLEPKHLCVIEGLSAETRRPVEEVEKIYVEKLSGLISNARIQDYLIVLTSKKVRDVLRQSGNSELNRTGRASPNP